MYNFLNNINNKNKPPHLKYKPSFKKGVPTSLKRGTPPLPEKGSKTISLFSQPYLDTYNQCYKNIVVVNLKPQGPLGNFVKLTKFPPLSEFKQPGPCSPLKDCGYAIISLDNCLSGCAKFGNDLMTVDEVPNLISYLVSNNYSVDTSLTNMFNKSDIRFDTDTGNKLICFITYNG
jgi:hypothetical protein